MVNDIPPGSEKLFDRVYAIVYFSYKLVPLLKTTYASYVPMHLV